MPGGGWTSRTDRGHLVQDQVRKPPPLTEAYGCQFQGQSQPHFPAAESPSFVGTFLYPPSNNGDHAGYPAHPLSWEDSVCPSCPAVLQRETFLLQMGQLLESLPTVGVMGLLEDIKAFNTLPTSREVCGLVGAQWDQILRCLAP